MSYSLIIQENKIRTEIELNDSEYRVLDIAIRHNRGMINLLSEVETILSSFNKKLIEFCNDSQVLKVKDEIISIFQEKIRINKDGEQLDKKENKPNSIVKTFNNKTVMLFNLC